MSTGINLPAVLIADALGMLMMLGAFEALYWRLFEKRVNNKKIVIIIGLVFFSCVADAATNLLEGTPGILVFVIVYAANWWLFFANMVMGPLWISLVKEYANIKESRFNTKIVAALVGFGVLFLLVNFFKPIVFSIDAQNNYSRGPLYLVYFILQIVFILDGSIYYFRAKNRGYIKRFFPVWQFILPIAFGILVQTFYYGVSTIWPCMAVSIFGIALCMQNETVYMDNLTGIFNRYYLDYLKNKIKRNSDLEVTAMMLDMNGFKNINDKYGHEEGDEALKTCADILSDVIGDEGTVIRYAGDEFVVLIRSQDKEAVDGYVKSIRESFDKYNEKSGKDYKLACSIGYCSVDLRNSTFDEIMNEVDKRMYEDKKSYYAKHDRRN